MRKLLERAYVTLWHRINRHRPWHHFPLLISVLNLIALRIELRDKNLVDTSMGRPSLPKPDARQREIHRRARSADGAYNDLDQPAMGRAGERFGRNVPLARGFPANASQLLEPSPRDISRRLMTREKFIPVPTLNVVAAAWIQFMTHDWFSHGDPNRERITELRIAEGDDWHQRSMKIAASRPDPMPIAPNAPTAASIPPTFANEVSHWWDASQIYGSDEKRQRELRSSEKRGRMALENGLLMEEVLADGTVTDRTGFGGNTWLGLSLLHTLFTREHNQICGMLEAKHPDWDDERLFQTARLINSALLAKIHTVEWTPGILNTRALRIAMDSNWWGLLGPKFKRRFPRLHLGDLLSGIPGSKTEHQGAPYAITEEFTAVYRLHALMPDEFVIRRLEGGGCLRKFALNEISLGGTRRVMEEAAKGQAFCIEDLWYSFGTSHPGAIALRNFPKHLQRLSKDDDILDLAALDIFRDRERGVPRYNDFRELVNMPRLGRLEDLTDDPRDLADLRALYKNDIDAVDLQVGLMAEKAPAGFGFSDTAFRIFILMASRRLKSDRFLSSDYTAEIYTQEGIDWVEDNTMKSVLVRNYPELQLPLNGVENAFAPWRSTA